MMLLATMPRLAANYLDELGASTAVAARIETPELPGCMTVPLPAALPVPTEDGLGMGPFYSGAYRCGGDLFVLTLRRYPPRIGVRPLFLSLQTAEVPPGSDDIIAHGFRAGSGPEAPMWRMTEFENDRHYFTVATALWLDGRPAGAGIAARVNQALNTVRRSAVSPVLVLVTHPLRDGPNNAWRAIDGFLDKTAPFLELVTKSPSAPQIR
jgi:hypothetical protein